MEESQGPDLSVIQAEDAEFSGLFQAALRKITGKKDATSLTISEAQALKKVTDLSTSNIPFTGSCYRSKAPRRVTKVGRNDPCPCGSGKKYKKCCLK